MLKHVVMCKFKNSASESAISEVEKGLGGLPAIISEIMEFEFGKDVLRSERSYDFALVSGFENLEKMERYRVHPAHQKVAVKLKEICDSMLIVDFET
ncbi:MAG: Dabb family protein [Syntrophobacteraceae bacterium]